LFFDGGHPLSKSAPRPGKNAPSKNVLIISTLFLISAILPKRNPMPDILRRMIKAAKNALAA
jgi:hypothetical protein